MLGPNRIALRPYQEDAIKAVRREFVEGKNSTLLVMATGLGKTVAFGSIVRQVIEKGGRALVLAHRKELINQAVNKLDLLGVQAEVERAELRARAMYEPDAVVATVQTLQRDRLKSWPRDHFRLVIIDEAHHATAASYRTILSHFVRAKVLGVTATVDRADEEDLGQVFESIADEYGLFWAMTAPTPGPYLCRLKFVQCDLDIDLSDLRPSRDDYSEADLEARIAPLADTLANALRQEFGERRTIVFTPGVKSAQGIATALQSLGVPADWSSGEDRERDAKIERFRDGRSQVFVNCLDDQTQILTHRGWLGPDEITDLDWIAAPGSQTGHVSWFRPDRIVRRERGEGERMVSIKNQTLDIRVTEGHRMLTRSRGAATWQFVEAGTLPDRVGPYQLPLACHDDRHDPIVPANTIHPKDLTPDQCRFIGLWIADGHIDRSPGCRGVTISQSAAYPEANAEIRRIFDSCGFDWKWSMGRATLSKLPQYRYRVPKGNIGGELTRSGFASLDAYLDKDFSGLLFGLNRDQTRCLIEGLWLGDGIKSRKRPPRDGIRTGWAICNTNKAMLDRLQWLVTTRGFAANISPPKDNGPQSTKPMYVIGIRDHSDVTTNNHTISTSGGNPARFEEVWKPEMVWCVTNHNGTIITRRNGKVAVMGQCGIATEGFDVPEVAAIGLCRPTKSRLLYSQMVGRGTRLARDKLDCLLIDFNYLTAKHDLVKPAELFDTSGTDSEVMAEADKVLDKSKGTPKDLLEAIEEGREEHKRKQVLRVQARERAITYRKVSYDPLAVCDVLGLPWRGSKDVATTRPTEKQIDYLKNFGVTDAPNLSRKRASAMIDHLKVRRERGLATFKQAAWLIAKGVPPEEARAMSFREASDRLDQLFRGRMTG